MRPATQPGSTTSRRCSARRTRRRPSAGASATASTRRPTERSSVRRAASSSGPLRARRRAGRARLRRRRGRRLGGGRSTLRAAVRPLDEDPARRRPAVWSIWCIRVRPGHRGRGIALPLLEGAVDYARDQGAPAVEGYPVDNRGAKVDLTMAYVGTRSLFERAGFTKAADTDAVSGGFPRVVMRRRCPRVAA